MKLAVPECVMMELFVAEGNAETLECDPALVGKGSGGFVVVVLREALDFVGRVTVGDALDGILVVGVGGGGVAVGRSVIMSVLGEGGGE